MARRGFLAQLAGLTFLALRTKAEESKRPLKIMMKSAWGSDDPTRPHLPLCMDLRWRTLATKFGFSSRPKLPI